MSRLVIENISMKFLYQSSFVGASHSASPHLRASSLTVPRFKVADLGHTIFLRKFETNQNMICSEFHLSKELR
jgi:hypothetical protein